MWIAIVVIAIVVAIIIVVGGLGSMICIGAAMKTLFKQEQSRADAQETDDGNSTIRPDP